MRLVNMPFPDLEKLKSLIKVAAQEELLKNFGFSEFEFKADGSVVTPADLAMQNRLERELKQHWPMYDILGEEMPDEAQLAVIDKALKSKTKGYWCIDPLDGTNNYASGLPFFAVSVALIIDNQQQLGLIYDPVRDEMFSAIKGQGAYVNNQLIDPSQMKFAKNKPIVAEIDLKRLPEKLTVKLVQKEFLHHNEI